MCQNKVPFSALEMHLSRFVIIMFTLWLQPMIFLRLLAWCHQQLNQLANQIHCLHLSVTIIRSVICMDLTNCKMSRTVLLGQLAQLLQLES